MKFRQVKLLIACLFFFRISHAQLVPIPDANFVAWLNAHGFSSCLTGSQLDTTCAPVLHDTLVDVSLTQITNLNGIQYFKGLRTLITTNSPIYSIPILPDSVTSLTCEQNQLVDLPAMPPHIRYLNCNSNFLTYLPYLPASLTYLDCSENQIGSLPFLPSRLATFYCFGNRITVMPALPDSLRSMFCEANSIHTMPQLPAHLDSLNCSYNLLTAIDSLPDSLTYLNCSYNDLNALGGGKNLTYLDCDSNFLSTLPAFFDSLQYLDCHYNALTQVPALPASLLYLDCSFNAIDSLPPLNDSLQYLAASHNMLQAMPAFPAGLSNISCAYNQLSALPVLPDSLYSLDCDSNANLHCLPQLTTIVILNFLNTPVVCVPNYGNVTNSYPTVDSLPLCDTVIEGMCGLINGIKNISATYLHLYPNPAADAVWMDTDPNMIGSALTLSDMSGRKIAGTYISENHFRLPLAGLAPGIYIVKIADENGSTARVKVEKE